MATLNELIYNIRNSKRGGILSDDDKVSDRQLAFIIGYYRAFFIKQELSKNKKIKQAYKQTIGCLPMKLVDRSECCDIPVGEKILRSCEKIPVPLEGSNGQHISYVGTVDGSQSFQFTKEDRIRWQQYSKFGSCSRTSFYSNGYIYVNNDKYTEYIKLQGVFENPEDLVSFQSSCSESSSPCFSYDSDYPLEDAMIPMINEMIFKNEMNLLTLSPQDTGNDTSDREQEQPSDKR